MPQIAKSIETEAGVPPKVQFPFLDLIGEFASTRSEILAAVEKVLESQHFILGPEVEAFETEVLNMVGSSYAISCASGSDALLLTLMGLGIGTGDEVITTPFTFIATAGAIARLGARPVFVDIEPDSFNLDPEQLKSAITLRTRAVLPIHLFGLPADMDPILEICRTTRLPVIEDAAQSIGAKYNQVFVGRIGTAGCFSFFPSKNLGGAGDGGIITTEDSALADRLRILRVHGSRSKYQYEVLGINSRLDAMQAAVLRVKLRYLEEWTSARRRNADRYSALFQEFGLDRAVQLPSAPSNMKHVYNQFVIRTPRRDDLRQHLRIQGIPTEVYYPHPLHLQRAFAYLGHKLGDFPISEQACSNVLALPICPTLTDVQQRTVVAAIAKYFQR